MNNILGIVGGLGSETCCEFCVSVNHKVRELINTQPHIILDNLPISLEAEEKLVNGGSSQEHLDLLNESIERLNKLDVSVIAIPCNTVHIFMDELRKNSRVPVLSIIEETARECKKLNLKRVGLLASTKTVETGLHSNQLKNFGIDVVTPNSEDQQFISECILKIINNTANVNDRNRMVKIIKNFNGINGVILGCTDLPRFLSNLSLNIPIISTTAVLENATVREMMKK